MSFRGPIGLLDMFGLAGLFPVPVYLIIVDQGLADTFEEVLHGFGIAVRAIELADA